MQIAARVTDVVEQWQTKVVSLVLANGERLNVHAPRTSWQTRPYAVGERVKLIIRRDKQAGRE